VSQSRDQREFCECQDAVVSSSEASNERLTGASRVRIAYLSADFGVPVAGTKGASIHVRALVHAMRAEGHEVLVLTPSTGDGASLAGCPVRELPFEATLGELVDALKQEPLCQGTRLAQDVRNLLYAAGLPQRARALLEDFRPEVLYERYSLLGTGGLALARELAVPLLVEVNAPLVLEQQKMRGLSLPTLARLAERRIFTGADHLFVVSKWLRVYAIVQGAAAEQVTVLPNAADPELFHPRQEPSELRGDLGWDTPFVIGFVGSMKSWHGVRILLEVLDQLGGAQSRFRLLLVGSGPMVPNLEEEVRRRGLEDVVHLTGSVRHEAVPKLVAAMDVAVAPYAADADGYFSPVKLFEYMAMACPVIAARVGQVEEVIEHGRTGWLYAPGSAEELARIIRSLAGDRPLRQRVGAAAREQALIRHTWRYNARRVVEIAEHLLAKGTARRVARGEALAHIVGPEASIASAGGDR
jgi:glycosyltransferase involved in cell wall biosynthesis